MKKKKKNPLLYLVFLQAGQVPDGNGYLGTLQDFCGIRSDFWIKNIFAGEVPFSFFPNAQGNVSEKL